MRTPEELAFIRDRVLAEIRANPPQGPLLGEAEPRALRESCRWGHTAYVTLASGRRECRECSRLSKQRQRAKAHRAEIQARGGVS